MTYTTEMVPAGAALTAPGAATSNITVAGSLILKINGQDYTLTGTVGSSLIVKFESEFPNGANIGTIAEVAGSVASALGAPGVKDKVDETIKSLDGVPVLGPVVKVIATSPIQITYLEINTATKTYGFGFALDFRDQDIKVGDIQLSAFGLKVTYVKPAA